MSDTLWTVTGITLIAASLAVVVYLHSTKEKCDSSKCTPPTCPPCPC